MGLGGNSFGVSIGLYENMSNWVDAIDGNISIQQI